MTETINFEQIGMLLGLAAARDQRTVGDTDNLAWHADLNTAGITYTDATEALTRFYAIDMPKLRTEDRFRITTPDLISIARKIRAERLANYAYVPPGAEEDPQYLDRLRGQIADVASGTVPAPTTPLAIAGGPHPDIADRLKNIGRYIPDDVRQQLAPYRTAAAARETAIRTGHADYLSVRCEWCGAPIDAQCRSRRVVPGVGATSTRARKAPHPSRIEAAQAATNRQERV